MAIVNIPLHVDEYEEIVDEYKWYFTTKTILIICLVTDVLCAPYFFVTAIDARVRYWLAVRRAKRIIIKFAKEKGIDPETILNPKEER